jgi:hypothetical protein
VAGVVTNLIGMTHTVKVVVVLVLEGSVPAMVKVRFTWVRSVKLPFHWTSCLLGTGDPEQLARYTGE